MINKIITKIFGTQSEREIKTLRVVVDKINSLESSMQSLSDAQLQAKTADFRSRHEKGESLDDLIPETFALVREAGRRTVRMRHFDMQLIGGMVLHQGKISEMKTGEGKTLVATLPAYLNSLGGKGVHVVTVNDYLARRDTEWMGKIYRFLGLSVGCVQHDMSDEARREAYGCDITYGTNNEFGFDYLRDNMKFEMAQCVQRKHHYAIVDEVDSILIDEARTPLIISGPAEESTDKYYRIDKIIPRLQKEVDYQVDEKHRTVSLTEEGIEKSEKYLGMGNLYEPSNMEYLHHINQALKAHTIFKRDVDYMVKEGQVIIVDEFTGRLMPGRRYSDGLHQALEAKENVKIERENQTLATITFQNYFRMYEKLSGMTGTAETEAEEFYKTYKLDVCPVPTHKKMIRTEYPDVIYRTEEEKYRAVCREIEGLHGKGQPVLVGTVSIEKSERLSKMLRRVGVPHVVLNAKYHEQEAEIVAQAGRKGAVTIATNMAGRGTDILLGGNPDFLTREYFRVKGLPPEQIPADQYQAIWEKMQQQIEKEREEVVSAGGLHILGTERHEARRIDNQLRGRAGRQGDPGSSRFYLSLEDDLMRIFASERISSIMQTLGMEEDVPIESKLITRQIERAQKQVEARNFDIRKHLLEYDDVMNKQREAVYAMRRRLLEGDDMDERIQELTEDLLMDLMDKYAAKDTHPDQWDLEHLQIAVQEQFALDYRSEGIDPKHLNYKQLADTLLERIQKRYREKETKIGAEVMRFHERIIMLQIVDSQWKDHLLGMDHLKEGIGLRGYAQREPLVEYKRESYNMFEDMMDRIETETIRFLHWLQPITDEERVQRMERERRREQQMVFQGSQTAETVTQKRDAGKVGRNDPCPCGSGKKFKKCHGVGN